MSHQNTDDYEDYEAQFDPLKSDRNSRRQRKPKDSHKAVDSAIKTSAESLEDIGDAADTFETTYQPSKYERVWLRSSMSPFFEQLLLTDILAVVKGGKEASVYRCRGSALLGDELVAAKVYRPRMFRSLSNDAMYKEGRSVLTSEGHSVKSNDHRIMRAIGKKSSFGESVAHTSWLMYEYTTIQQLYAIGAAVPKPLASAENAILMEYIGDDQIAAPPLSEVSLETDEAASVFHDVISNIELMLRHGMIHGDLSAYNILYWLGKTTIIDFPQVTSLQDNRNSLFILSRDIKRVCVYFVRQGVEADADGILTRMWNRYGEDSAGNPDSFANVSAADDRLHEQEQAEDEEEY